MLRRQALRSVWRGRRSYIACVLLMSIGVGVYISFNLLYANLSAAMESYYGSQRFGDAFASVESIPLSAAERLSGIPGIARVGAASIANARVEREDSSKIITLRLSSFDPREAERLNDFVLIDGSIPGEGEILLGEGFAAAGGIAPGDTLTLIIGGKRITPVVSGLVQSPEYVYVIPDAGQMLPDMEAFGFGYMDAGRLGLLTGKPDIANSLSFLLEDGASYSELEPMLEDALAPYGLKAVYERKNQASHTMLDSEITSLGTMSTSFPMIFIMIAVIILYIMLKRIIEQERMQIGTLKAFGFSGVKILSHYLTYGGIAGAAGGLGGVALGLLMTDAMGQIYIEYFSLPAIRVPPNPVYPAAGFAIALVSGLAGALMGTRKVLRLDPAEAMRSESPPALKHDMLGKLPFLRAILASHGYMAVRNIGRNRFRSGFIAAGLAFSFAITAFMASYGDMFDAMLMDQFNKVEVYNIKASLKAPTPLTPAIEAAYALDGVRRAEPMMELPVELRKEHLREMVSVTAIEGESQLYKLYDAVLEQSVELPPGGAILSSALADKLLVKRGDILSLRTQLSDDEYPLPVLGVMNSNLGMTAYIRLETLWDTLGIPPSATALLIDAEHPPAIKEALADAQNISALTDQQDAMKIYLDFVDTYSGMMYMLQLAGVGIALTIIRSTASISLSERKREYATMRVMGMHPGEIASVAGFEYWVLLAVSLPFGIALTRILKEAINGMVETEMFSMPTHTSPMSYLSALALCMAAVFISNHSAKRKIARFDMVEVLKERE